MIMNFVFWILVVTASIFLFECIVALINWIAEKYSDINQAITQSENWEHSKSDIYNRIEKLEREGKEMTVEQLAEHAYEKDSSPKFGDDRTKPHWGNLPEEEKSEWIRYMKFIVRDSKNF